MQLNDIHTESDVLLSYMETQKDIIATANKELYRLSERYRLVRVIIDSLDTLNKMADA